VQAIMYGPLVLAGKLGTEGLTAETLRAAPTRPRAIPEYLTTPVPPPSLKAPSDDLASWIKPVAGKSLEFRTTGQEEDVTLVPFNRVLDERYGIYWRLNGQAASVTSYAE